MSYITSIVHC